MTSIVATVSSEFQRDVVDSGRLAAFLFFVALLGTFAFIRTSTWMIRKQVSWWPGNVSVGGTHVHHLVWGICAMMIFGYVGVVHQPESPWREIITVLFAIGMGLTLDEFALWVELKDVYWEKDGRKSIDAMVIAGCVAGILLVGFTAWLKLADDVGRGAAATVGFIGMIGILTAILNVAKEKFVWAAVSLVFWPAGAVTGGRLAKPHSIWARAFYHDAKLQRARERYGVAGAEPDAGTGPDPPAESPASRPDSSSPSGAGQSSS